jgi:hypothetical protein
MTANRSGSSFGAFLISIVLSLSGCDGGSKNNAESTNKGDFTDTQICKAGIATVMGREPKIMTIDRVQTEVIYLSYIRQDDQSKWVFKCKLDGNQIVWGNDDGRWRDNAADSAVRFYVSGKVISIAETFGDGSVTRNSFGIEGLSQ